MNKIKFFLIFFLTFFAQGTEENTTNHCPPPHRSAYTMVLAKKSFNIQKKERYLYDLSDPLGINFLQNIKIKLQRPFLFPIVKNNKVGFLLGTCHNLPIRFFGKKALRCINSCKSLVVENEEDSPTRDSWEKVGAVVPNAQPDEFWLEDMPNPAKQYLDWVLSYACKNKKSTNFINPWELTPYGALIGSYAANMAEGMESNLKKLIKGPKHGLEKIEESLPLLMPKKISIIDLFLELEEVVAYGSLQKQCFLAQNTVIEPYMIGPCDYTNQLFYELGLSNVQRNHNWIAKWDNVFETLERPLFAVGVSHLYGPDGLWNLLRQKGYTIGDCTTYWEA